MSTGGYQSGPFRTAANTDNLVQVMLEAITQARGTAYASDRGSVVWIENLAIAKTLADAWETARRFSLQFDPVKMSVFVERWEKILSIIPAPNETMNERRRTIAEKFKLFINPALSQAVQDMLAKLIPDIFLNIIYSDTTNATSYVPGGVTIPGGVTLTSGAWRTSIHNLAVRVFQPSSMTDLDFYDQANKFRRAFDSYIPAYVTYSWGRFAEAEGTISLPANTLTVTGDSTQFINSPGGALVAGDQIEVFDDEMNVVTLTVDNIFSNNSLQVIVKHTFNITDKTWRRIGFYLDQQNVDNSFLKV